MPLLMCPNDNQPMQTLERSGVSFDMCPTCRGVWLDRGELESLMAAATGEARPAAAPQPWPSRPDDRRYKDDRPDDRHRRKKGDSIFDIFD